MENRRARGFEHIGNILKDMAITYGWHSDSLQNKEATGQVKGVSAYLVRKNPNHRQVAHYWNGSDTLCRLYSTGGMAKGKYEVVDKIGDLPICTMCKTRNTNQ